ncbi:MAG: hypothetical protein JNL01_02255 [Bdellovibrionales bacterium]|nr:hypothetical protein [Bdellovibrionales bacterium]
MESRPIQKLAPDVRWDTPLGFFLILLGSGGVYFSGQQSVWRELANDEPDRVVVAQVKPLVGSVRVRHPESQVWEDAPESLPAVQGDTVFTDDQSQALLIFQNQNEVRVAPGSLVVVRVEEREEKGFFGAVRTLLGQTQGQRTSVEVQKGAIEVRSHSDQAAQMAVYADGKRYVVAGSNQKAKVDIFQTDGGVKIQARDGEAQVAVPGFKKAVHVRDGKALAVDVEEDGKLSVAQGKTQALPDPKGIAPMDVSVLSPMNGASVQVKAGVPAEIQFRWQPLASGLSAELLIEGVKGTSTDGMKNEVSAGRMGTMTQLSSGRYVWQVRSKNTQGKTSNWSKAQVLELTEAPVKGSLVMGGKPIPVPVVADAAPAPVKTAPQKVQIARAGTPEVSVAIADLASIQYTVSWNAVPGAKGYKVTLKDGSKVLASNQAKSTTTTLKVTQAPKSGAFVYEVAALGVARSPASVTTKKLPFELPKPAGAVPAAGKQIPLFEQTIFSWTRTPLAKGYEIQIASDAAFKARLVSAVQRENFYSYRPQKAGNFYWRVRSLSTGSPSPWSEPTPFSSK